MIPPREKPPTQEEIETAAFKLLEYGDETSIASWALINQGLVSRLFSPRKPDDVLGMAKAMREVYGCYGTRISLGDAYVELFNRFALRCRRIFAPNSKKQVQVEQQEDTTRDAVFKGLKAVTENMPYAKRIKFLEECEREVRSMKETYMHLDCEDSPDEKELQQASALQ